MSEDPADTAVDEEQEELTVESEELLDGQLAQLSEEAEEESPDGLYQAADTDEM